MPLPSPRLALGVLLSCAALAGACSDPVVARPAPSSPPSPATVASPAPSPTPAPPPAVDGTVELTAIHLESAGQRLYAPGSPGDLPPAVDEPAVHAFVGDVDRWLDARLTALQQGVVPALPGHLDAAVSPEAATAITTALTGPDALVSNATYAVEVALDGGPRWAAVTVAVDRADGTTARADFVFVPGADGPVLIAAGPTGEVAP